MLATLFDNSWRISRNEFWSILQGKVSSKIMDFAIRLLDYLNALFFLAEILKVVKTAVSYVTVFASFRWSKNWYTRQFYSN